MPKDMFKRLGDPVDIEFYINGTKHTVQDKFPPTTSLNDYIRDVAGLSGTKVMCKEAGCGCCAVTVTYASESDKLETMSINSCMSPLYSVDGWQITTTEGIGNSKVGFHPIQDRMVKHNATQCGYCTPGFVMSMYGLLHQDPAITQQEIEDSLDGHMCRCTGYRSILDALKTFGSDSNSPDSGIHDIEDLNKRLCPKTGERCNSASKGVPSKGPRGPGPLSIDLRESRWYRPTCLQDLGKILQKHKSHSTTMLFGNTASGIFKYQGPFDVYIDLRAVKELYTYKEGSRSVTVGAGTTLTKLKERFTILQSKPGFHYSVRVIRHLKVLASVLVRNAGCIAGNLMIKHGHPNFPSDLFTMMEAIGANIEIFDSKSSKITKHTLMEFLRKVDMKGKVITALEIPQWEKRDHYRSFKITPRWQNAHAYVNAAFKIPIEGRKVVGKPNIVIGGISAETVHAINAEEFLKNKTLTDQVINEALRILHSELNPVAEPVISSPKYRRELAVNLLYKTLLEVYKPSKYSLQSGAASMERPLSSGLQTFAERAEAFPLRQPLPKKTAPLQTSGEAEFVDDMPSFQYELHAAMVVAEIGSGKLQTVDTATALKTPGVLGYISSADIPSGGTNNYIPDHPIFGGWSEEALASEDIEYAGQAIGLILADTQALAEEGARKVKVTYRDVKSPIIDLETAIAKNSYHEGAVVERVKGDVKAGIKEAHIFVDGEINEGSQYHYYIENQVALSVPSEDGMDVYAACQSGDCLQRSLSQVLGKAMNYFNVTVPRLGGGFGGKIIHAFQVGTLAALASEVTGRPVRLNIDLSTNMKFNAKRFPIKAKYKAGCDKSGKLKFIQVDIYVDSGVRPTPMIFDLVPLLDQGYYCPNWKVKLMQMKTNKPTGAAARGPGSVPASLIIETIMEHLAKTLKQHPIMIKEINLFEEGQTDIEGVKLTYCSLKRLWQSVKQTAGISARMEDVNRFNKNNQWRKRGITMCAVKYTMLWFAAGFPTHVSIFALDGSVTVMTTGVEMGQGLFMKVAQAVAASLKVPLDNVKVRPIQNNVCPNALVTGASTSSERCVGSALRACEILNDRLAPLREKMPDADWKTLVNAALWGNVELQVNSTHFSNLPSTVAYATYMAGAVETEVDVLTGEYQVRRVDIMADFGESMNPRVDIGQIEGAFVMGLGAYLSEDIIYDQRTGAVLNDGTWEYKPPTTKDIPIDWRIHLLPDAPNPNGVLSSKAVGEPPIGLAVGALLSIKNGIECVKEDLTGKREFLSVVAPYTVEKAQQDTGIIVDHLRVSGQN